MSSAPKRSLPAEFADLESFVESWALPTMQARHRRRIASTAVERKAFYDAMTPRLAAITAYLDKLPLHELAPDARRLLELALSLAEVSLTREVFTDEVEAVHAKSAILVRVGHEMDGL